MTGLPLEDQMLTHAERATLQTGHASALAEPLPLEDPVERLIVPAKRRLKLRHIVREASVIRVLAARDFKIKYKQSILGPLWLVFQPLALLAAFMVAFRGLGDVKTSGVPYAVFALVGLSAWSFFQASMTIGTASLITNSNFVRYTPCPRPAFPLATIIASLPSYAVTAGAALLAAAATGDLSLRALLLPVGFAWLLLLTTAAIGFLSALAVRYRDIINALPFLMMVGVFFAPVGYSLPGLSPVMRRIVELNPLTGVMETFRWMTLSGYRPSLGPVVLSLGVTAILSLASWRIFSSIETTMADEI